MKPATVTQIQANVLQPLSLGPKDCDTFQALRSWQNTKLHEHNVCTLPKLL